MPFVTTVPYIDMATRTIRPNKAPVTEVVTSAFHSEVTEVRPLHVHRAHNKSTLRMRDGARMSRNETGKKPLNPAKLTQSISQPIKINPTNESTNRINSKQPNELTYQINATKESTNQVNPPHQSTNQTNLTS